MTEVVSILLMVVSTLIAITVYLWVELKKSRESDSKGRDFITTMVQMNMQYDFLISDLKHKINFLMDENTALVNDNIRLFKERYNMDGYEYPTEKIIDVEDNVIKVDFGDKE